MKYTIYAFLLLIVISSCSPRIITPLSESKKSNYQPEEIEEIFSDYGFSIGTRIERGSEQHRVARKN